MNSFESGGAVIANSTANGSVNTNGKAIERAPKAFENTVEKEAKNATPDLSKDVFSSREFDTGPEPAEKIRDAFKDVGIEEAFRMLAEGKVGEKKAGKEKKEIALLSFEKTEAEEGILIDTHEQVEEKNWKSHKLIPGKEEPFFPKDLKDESLGTTQAAEGFSDEQKQNRQTVPPEVAMDPLYRAKLAETIQESLARGETINNIDVLSQRALAKYTRVKDAQNAKDSQKMQSVEKRVESLAHHMAMPEKTGGISRVELENLILELLKILHEKEEEEKKKRGAAVQVLVSWIAKLMQMLYTDDQEVQKQDEKKKQTVEQDRHVAILPTETKEGTILHIAQLRQYKKSTETNSTPPISMLQPHRTRE